MFVLDTDTFSHTGANGSTPQDRMAAAGYVFQGHWEAGENIAAEWGNGVTLDQAAADKLETDLFLSPEHRVNLLSELERCLRELDERWPEGSERDFEVRCLKSLRRAVRRIRFD